MVGSIKWPHNQSFGIAATGNQMEWLCGPLSIRLIPENAVGNDVSKCATIQETATGTLHYIATTTPPQEYDLPLAEGITALQPCTYYKNQFGEVIVGGTVAGTISQDTIIGTLPVGYRPIEVIERPATIGTGSTRYPGTIFINPYGVITITTPAPEMAAVFAASFIAIG